MAILTFAAAAAFWIYHGNIDYAFYCAIMTHQAVIIKQNFMAKKDNKYTNEMVFKILNR